MSQQETVVTLQIYMRRLKEMSEPTRNDKRYTHYVKYANRFLVFIGNERVYLVGSTGELSKLRWSTDEGDADFILVSGRLTIPVDNLQHREGMEDYVWIKTKNLDIGKCEMECNTQYLCPDILKTVSPNLYTTLRGLYTIVTSTSDDIPGRHSRIVTTAKQSKVGLAREEYRNLNIEDDCEIDDTNKRMRTVQQNTSRSPEFVAYLEKRWKTAQVFQEDLKLLRRILKAAASAKVPGTRGQGYGQFAYFASILDEALKRPVVRKELDSLTSTNNTESVLYDRSDRKGKATYAQKGDELDSFTSTYSNDIEPILYDRSERKVKATYTQKSSKDFVLAFRTIGTLNCMEMFRRRVKEAHWPSESLVDEIFKEDVFIVARLAPVNPHGERDFRLSFNLQEIKLVQNFPSLAKDIFIVLKSYLKGVIRQTFSKNNLKSKIRSYHMKTIMFWMCEKEGLDFWNECNAIIAIQKVLDFLQSSLREKFLKHYFTESNLFVDYEDHDYRLLLECVDKLFRNPVSSVEVFFEMDKEVFGEVWLSTSEVRCIKSMQEDGGRHKNVDQIEDAIIDLLRGLADNRRNAAGNSAFKEAILSAVDLFLEDEHKDNTKEIPNQVNTAQAVAGFMNALVTNFGNESHNSRGANERLGFLVQIGSLFDEGRDFINSVGGQAGIRNVLQATEDDNSRNGIRLRGAVEHLLSCSDEMEEDAIARLKQECTAYFIGRKGL